MIVLSESFHVFESRISDSI